jgi:proline iminopeptidase
LCCSIRQATAIGRSRTRLRSPPKRGYRPEKAELVRRWFNGEFTPREYYPILMRIADAYCYGNSWRLLARALIHGGWRSKSQPEAAIYAGRHLLKGWTVMDRLSEIAVPTLVMAGRQGFVFPPEAQAELASGILGARLHIVERTGHNPDEERTAEGHAGRQGLHLRRVLD